MTVVLDAQLYSRSLAVAAPGRCYLLTSSPSRAAHPMTACINISIPQSGDDGGPAGDGKDARRVGAMDDGESARIVGAELADGEFVVFRDNCARARGDPERIS